MDVMEASAFVRGDAKPRASPDGFGLTPWLGRTRKARAQELPTCCSISGPSYLIDFAEYRKHGPDTGELIGYARFLTED